MRIVITCFADVRRGGGGATKALQVAGPLRARGHEVVVVSRADPEASLEDRRVEGIPVRFFHARAGRAWRVPSLVVERRIAEVFRERVERPDALLAVHYGAVNAARKAWPGIPVLFLLPCLLCDCLPNLRPPGRLDVFGRLNEWLIARGERRALRRATAVIAPTRALACDVERVAGRTLRDLRICPNGVPDLAAQVSEPRPAVRRRFDTPDGAVVALMAGSLDRNKNVFGVLESLRRCARPELVLWIAGRGELEDSLLARIAELGLQQRVRLLGYQMSMPSIYAAADLFVHAARYEAFGNVYLEAMVSGLPVIGPRRDRRRIVSTLDEILEPGMHGLLHDPDRPEELAGHLAWFVDHPDERDRMGQAARRHVLGRFTWDRYVDQVERALGLEPAGPVRPAGSWQAASPPA